MNANLVTGLPSESAIAAAIRQQLPRGFEQAPCWFPLEINGEQFYIMGSVVIDQAAMDRRTRQIVEGLCA